MSSGTIGRTVVAALLLGVLALAYGCYLEMFTEVRYTADYPHFKLWSHNSTQWIELRSGAYADSDQIAPLYVNLSGKVYFLPDLTEANVSEYAIPVELRSAEGADPETGLRARDEYGTVTYFAGFNQFDFRHGKLVAVSFDSTGPRIGLKPEGPFRSVLMRRAEATTFFGAAERIEKVRHKRNLVFR